MLLIAFIWFFTFMIFRQAPEWDNMEELVWANSFELGYQKHPPLPTWILYPLTLIFGRVIWLPTALGLICVALGQWITYQLYVRIAEHAKLTNPQEISLLAILVSSPLIYFSIRGGDYNHNAMQLWSIAAMYYFYYRAWEKETVSQSPSTYFWYWSLMGLMMGLAFISKYSVVIQIGVLIAHFCWVGRWRRSRSWIGVLLAAVVFLCITTPHLVWLYQQTELGQGPIYYASQLMTTQLSLFERCINMLKDFLLTQVFRLLPCFLVVGVIYLLYKKTALKGGNFAARASWWSQVQRQDQQFLIWLALGPCVLAMLIGIVLDQKIEAKWAVTFFIVIGFIGWRYANDLLDVVRLRKTVIVGHLIFAVSFGVITGPVASYLGKQGRSNFPSQALANVIEQRWQEHSELTKGEPIRLIVGDTWIIGHTIIHDQVNQGKNIKPWIDANDLSSPWMKPEDKHHTALILIDQGIKQEGRWWRAGHPPSKEVQRMFDQAPVKGVEVVPWTMKEGAPPLEIQWAILPYEPS